MPATLIETKIINQLNDAIEESLRRGLIIFRGAFQSGKTRIIRSYLQSRPGYSLANYLNLNRYLVQKLQEDISAGSGLNLKVLSQLPGKTTALFSGYIERYCNT